MEGSIVGRDEELAAIGGFLAARELLPARLTLVGESGIGKTSLWRHSVRLAREAGYRVLASAPTVGESRLAHVVLGDLLEGSLAQTLPELPLLQRRAVEVALLLADAGDEEIDPRALGLALLGSLRVLAAVGPVLVAVDDQQWADRSSAAALEFALRRLQRESVGLLVSRRPGEPD